MCFLEVGDIYFIQVISENNAQDTKRKTQVNDGNEACSAELFEHFSDEVKFLRKVNQFKGLIVYIQKSEMMNLMKKTIDLKGNWKTSTEIWVEKNVKIMNNKDIFILISDSVAFVSKFGGVVIN